jgi:rhomboid protease GluP
MTRVLVAINVVVFAAMVVSGVSVTDPTPPDLVRWGALFGPFALDGQWWRLLTCCFIHIGVIHLLLNMWVLSTGGPVLERMVGNVGFLILYLISGLGGSLAALFWSPDVVAAGASGAVFGVFGALLGVLRKQRASIPRAALAGLKNFGVSFLMVNLVFGFMLPNISVSAHVGGAATGFLCGLVLSRPFTPEGVAGRPGQNVLTGVLGAVAIVLGAFLVSAMRPNFAEIHREMDRRDEVERRLRDIVNTAAGKVGRREMTDPEFARILERDVLPEWRATTDRLAAHGSLPGEMGKRVAAVIEYMRLQREAWELFVQAVREGDETTFARATEKQRLVDEAVNRLNSEKNR